FEKAIHEIIDAGGDTDTNAAIMGQLAGSALGFKNLPPDMLSQIQLLEGYAEIEVVLSAWEEQMKN
ncbi:MAG: ADP-ribosylglycohydrolase family protein, partial [Bacteroidota bacterium]